MCVTSVCSRAEASGTHTAPVAGFDVRARAHRVHEPTSCEAAGPPRKTCRRRRDSDVARPNTTRFKRLSLTNDSFFF